MWLPDATRREAAAREGESNCEQLTQLKCEECRAEEEADTQQCSSSGLRVLWLWEVAWGSCRKCGVQVRREERGGRLLREGWLGAAMARIKALNLGRVSDELLFALMDPEGREHPTLAHLSAFERAQPRLSF